jgi:hypothetical protein
MSDPSKLVQNPEEDTVVLERLERYAIEHFPNPQRRGCPPMAVLANFVDHRSEVSVADLNDLHILQCAECTQDLRQLRLERELRRSKLDKPQTNSWWWRIAAAAVLVLCIAIPVQWHRRSSDLYSPKPYVADLVLEHHSSERGPEATVQLPRRAVLLHITLPPGEFDHAYRLTLARERTVVDPLLQAQAPSKMTVSGLRIAVRLDLSRIDAGGYWIGIRGTEKPDTWFTFVELK